MKGNLLTLLKPYSFSQCKSPTPIKKWQVHYPTEEHFHELPERCDYWPIQKSKLMASLKCLQ